MPIEYQVKVSTGGDDLVRMKIAGDITFKAFLKNVEEALSLPDDMCVDKCRYFDEDGDRILLKNEKQFKNALQEFTEKQRFKIEVHKSDIISRDQLITKVLTDYREYLEDRSKYHFGYPYNLHYDHEEIFDVMKYSINNLGDPFVESNYGVHSRRFELDVLAFFAEMWQIPEGDYWGYVTSCGTEGNLHSILCAREMQPDGVLYASKDSHYSVFKACKFYRMPYEVVASKPSGEMDYEDFSKCLNQHPGKPAIIVANIGTTVKGAVDSVDTIIKTLEDHGIPEDKRVIHCDGALYALMLPFMEQFEQVNFTKKIHSMCVSGHKFLGCPMPCGVVIARKANIEKVSERVEYLNSVDTTIMGSRNGHAPIFLWYSLQKGGFEELQKKVKLCHANARLLFTMLKDRNIKALLNDRSTTVVLSRPPEAFVKHWQLACEGEIAHVVVMPNVTVEKIVQFVGELEEAFKGTWVAYHQDGGENPSCNKDVYTT
ncbi:Serine decarboxylase 1 [Diplonema papillatum]|nr:Serine decarboxylase 1 [Diplonema papillatum]KAJ9470184.1 Serine decarboxylase 1 [Diplonema papillatum]